MPQFVASATPDVPMDEFTRGYFEAMEWVGVLVEVPLDDTTGLGPEDPTTEIVSLGELANRPDTIRFSPEAIATICDECKQFQEGNADSLAVYYETHDESRAGNDFFLTRNHHGAGFWDSGQGAAYAALTDAAHDAGGMDGYIGEFTVEDDETVGTIVVM